jgi:hypothetical protein
MAGNNSGGHVATEAEGSGEEKEEWDDQGYALGAVALPLEGSVGMVQVAAAGTKAGAEKARATRAAAKKGQGKGVDGGAVAVQTAGGGGTALIAKPLDVAATAALRGRRDKAAAKERLGKLPDHGQHVAPQGLNRLPAGFPVRTTAPQTQGASVLAAQHIPAGVDAEHRVHVLPLRAEAPLRRVTPPGGVPCTSMSLPQRASAAVVGCTIPLHAAYVTSTTPTTGDDDIPTHATVCRQRLPLASTTHSLMLQYVASAYHWRH